MSPPHGGVDRNASDGNTFTLTQGSPPHGGVDRNRLAPLRSALRRWSPPHGGVDRNRLELTNCQAALRSPPHGGVDRNIGMSHGLGPKIRPQPPLPHQSNLQLMVRFSTIKFSNFNALQPGTKTPIAPGRGENWPFGERFGRSLRSQSPERAAQTPGKPGVFQAVSPVESGSLPGRWRRIGNRDRTLSGRRRARRRVSHVSTCPPERVPTRQSSTTSPGNGSGARCHGKTG